MFKTLNIPYCEHVFRNMDGQEEERRHDLAWWLREMADPDETNEWSRIEIIFRSCDPIMCTFGQ